MDNTLARRMFGVGALGPSDRPPRFKCEWNDPEADWVPEIGASTSDEEGCFIVCDDDLLDYRMVPAPIISPFVGAGFGLATAYTRWFDAHMVGEIRRSEGKSPDDFVVVRRQEFDGVLARLTTLEAAVSQRENVDRLSSKKISAAIEGQISQLAFSIFGGSAASIEARGDGTAVTVTVRIPPEADVEHTSQLASQWYEQLVQKFPSLEPGDVILDVEFQ